jgi:hypothetical protein
MLKILAGLTWKTCLVYLDDIIVFAKTFEEQIKNRNVCKMKYEFAIIGTQT